MHGIRYRFAAFELDSARRSLRYEGAEVRLTGKCFELLLLLARRGGEVVTRQQAVAALWPDTTVHENSLAVAINTLRQALTRACPSAVIVETVPRLGYRLAAPVLEVVASSNRPGRGPHAGRRELVGREHELERLLGLFREAQGGNGALAWVTGEPGIGKTALLEHALRELSGLEPSLIVGSGKCLSLDLTHEPFFPVIEAISQMLRGPSGELVKQALVTHCPHWCLHHPGQFAGHGVLERLQRAGALIDATALMRQLCDALISLTAQAPLVMSLEDLHWADRATADLIRILASRVTRERLLVIGTYRAATATTAPQALRGLVHQSDGAGQLLHLAPLREAHVLLLVEREYPGVRNPEQLAHWLWARSEGLPLFVARLLSSAIDEAALAAGDVGSEACDWLAADVFSGAPSSVTGFIRQQLLGLPKAARTLLDVAAVSGDEFLVSTIGSALSLTEEVVEQQLDAVESGHQLVSRLGDEELHDGRLTARFRFCHALVRAELYELLTAQRRIELHARVADALAAPGPDAKHLLRSDEHYQHRGQSELAFHLERARQFAGAVLALLRAGDYCDRRFAKQQALLYYDRAWHLLSKTNPAEQALFRLLLSQNRGWARLGLGELDEARAEFRLASSCARELERTEREPTVRAALQLGFGYLDVEWEDPLLRRPSPMLLEGAERPGVQALRAEAYFGECAALGRAERYPELLEVANELLELGQRTQNGRRQAEALAWLGVGHFELGDFEHARSVADACLDLARTVGSARATEMSSLTHARLHALRGEFEKAAESYDAVRHRTVLSAVAALCLRELGDLRCKQGRIRAAFAQHTEAVELARGALGNRAVPSTGWIYRELGAPGQALELDLQALACCPATDQPRRRALLCSIAASHARLGDPARAQLFLKEVKWTEPAQKNLANLQQDWLARCEIHLALEQHESLSRLAASWHAAARAHAAGEGMLRASAFLARSAIASGDLERARRQLEPALTCHRTHSMPLIGLPVLRYRQLVELQSGRLAAAEHARGDVEATVERVASSIDDAALRRAFREMAKADARSAPHRTSPRTGRASARAT